MAMEMARRRPEDFARAVWRPSMGTTPVMTSELRAKYQQLADNLQIPLYIRADGTVHQQPPGERLEPDPAAGPNLNHGASPPAPAEAG